MIPVTNPIESTNQQRWKGPSHTAPCRKWSDAVVSHWACIQFRWPTNSLPTLTWCRYRKLWNTGKQNQLISSSYRKITIYFNLVPACIEWCEIIIFILCISKTTISDLHWRIYREHLNHPPAMEIDSSFFINPNLYLTSLIIQYYSISILIDLYL